MAVRVRKGGGEATHEHDAAPETPSARIIAAANKIELVKTETGMVLGLRKLGALDEMRITRAVGMDASNQQFFLWCMLAAAVAEIDGDRLPMPETQLECEAVIQRIGDAGVAAIQIHAVQKIAAANAAARRSGKKPKPDAAESEFIDSVKK